ncbi:ImuA family protein [Methylobacterium sp. A54F]
MERSHDEPEADEPRRDRTAILAELRGRLGHGPERQAGSVLPIGIPTLDGRLPGSGLALGRPHEIAPLTEGDEAAALGFALALVALRLARVPGEALLVLAPGHPTPYGHGLAALGLDPDRLLVLEAGGDAEVHLALEEALRTGSLPAVAGFLDGGLPLTQGRRLQLAAEAGAPLLLILRPAAADLPNGAATRWRIAAGPALRDRFGCTVRARWRARLDRCRNGRPGDWLLEWDHAAHRFGLPEPLADHAPAPRAGRG